MPKDIFQDYDILYVVSETKHFYEDELWIDYFGSRLYMQMLGKMDFLRGNNHNFDETYGWLIQYTCSVGKSGKYMCNFLEEDMYNRFLSTYADGKVENIWNATLLMCDLFDEVAVEVSKKLGYKYNQEEADTSRSFLEHVRSLPRDAKKVY